MGFIYTQKEYKETGHSQNRPTTDSRSREMAMIQTKWLPHHVAGGHCILVDIGTASHHEIVMKNDELRCIHTGQMMDT